MRKLFQVALTVALAAMLVLPTAAQNVPLQERGAKRLILKDGGYQLATKWEIIQDRVRYYSAERSEWEEIPNDLIDWKATEEWNNRKPADKLVAPEVAAAIAEDEAARREDQARTPEVAPGLNLPITGGVFLLDRLKGENQLVEVVQNGSDIKKNTVANTLKAAINPLALSIKQSIELKEPHARIQSHTAQPVLFINLDPQGIYVPVDPQKDAEEKAKLPPVPERYVIVRAKQKGSSRVVGNLKIALTGKMSEQRDMIPTVAEEMGGGWVRIKPMGTLDAGEYALIELLGKNQMNLYVWDFGVNPAAPANPSAWKARQPETTKTGTTQSPALGKRPN